MHMTFPAQRTELLGGSMRLLCAGNASQMLIGAVNSVAMFAMKSARQHTRDTSYRAITYSGHHIGPNFMLPCLYT